MALLDKFGRNRTRGESPILAPVDDAMFNGSGVAAPAAAGMLEAVELRKSFKKRAVSGSRSRSRKVAAFGMASDRNAMRSLSAEAAARSVSGVM